MGRWKKGIERVLKISSSEPFDAFVVVYIYVYFFCGFRNVFIFFFCSQPSSFLVGSCRCFGTNPPAIISKTNGRNKEDLPSIKNHIIIIYAPTRNDYNISFRSSLSQFPREKTIIIITYYYQHTQYKDAVHYFNKTYLLRKIMYFFFFICKTIDMTVF